RLLQRVCRDLLVRHNAVNLVPAGRPHARGLTCNPGHDARLVAREGEHLRTELRWGHLLGAVLGTRDCDRLTARTELHAMGDLHRRGRREPAWVVRGRGRRAPGTGP